MSIPGNTPYYLLVTKVDEGKLTYKLMNPRGWKDAQLIKEGSAPTIDWILNSVQNLVPPWQEDIDIKYL